jgi:intein-encoded DNA endonuclease-like protein
MSTIHIVKNGNDKGKTKHMDVRYHYIRELLTDKQVEITHKSTSDMIADLLTKPLDRLTFSKLRSKLLGLLIHPA